MAAGTASSSSVHALAAMVCFTGFFVRGVDDGAEELVVTVSTSAFFAPWPGLAATDTCDVVGRDTLWPSSFMGTCAVLGCSTSFLTTGFTLGLVSRNAARGTAVVCDVWPSALAGGSRDNVKGSGGGVVRLQDDDDVRLLEVPVASLSMAARRFSLAARRRKMALCESGPPFDKCVKYDEKDTVIVLQTAQRNSLSPAKRESSLCDFV